MKRKSPTRPVQARHVLATTLDEELVLFDPSTQHAHILNRTATAIWQLCDGTRDRIQIAREVASFCRASLRQVLPDVTELVTQFQERGLVDYVPVDRPAARWAEGSVDRRP